MSNLHKPVLLTEVMQYLAIKPDGVYVDATFGRGGHSQEILNRLDKNGILLAIDKDPSAVQFGKENFHEESFQIRQGSFAMLESFIDELGLQGKVDGILLDLGVSSPQLDESERGFSFLQDGPLDMRMNPNDSPDAASWLNSASEEAIAQVLWEYGEERFSRRIARAIVEARKEEPFTRTKRLSEIVSKANPAWEKHKHPATRSFQAIRIYINHELDELKLCLEQSLSALGVGGRLAVISFHSLEDQIVKAFMRKKQQGGDYPRNLPVTQDMFAPEVKRIAWGITAKEQEVNENPRSRSAILRVVEKIQ
ncbi:MAG: 16S rRNA (cytosine(1402)-N(4))-methyltransferase RsmH [Gammaproteobacteria bacterium]|nr:16S rRNA (cytosine(1402)-N(4))-methyltransferase RsmH [Gammaproteobacteria bacterium]